MLEPAGAVVPAAHATQAPPDVPSPFPSGTSLYVQSEAWASTWAAIGAGGGQAVSGRARGRSSGRAGAQRRSGGGAHRRPAAARDGLGVQPARGGERTSDASKLRDRRQRHSQGARGGGHRQPLPERGGQRPVALLSPSPACSTYRPAAAACVELGSTCVCMILSWTFSATQGAMHSRARHVFGIDPFDSMGSSILPLAGASLVSPVSLYAAIPRPALAPREVYGCSSAGAMPLHLLFEKGPTALGVARTQPLRIQRSR